MRRLPQCDRCKRLLDEHERERIRLGAMRVRLCSRCWHELMEWYAGITRAEVRLRIQESTN